MPNKYDFFTTFDKPIPYKKLLFYPVLMKDCFMFNYMASCLLIDKNSIPDIKVISMTYWEYLVESHAQNNSDDLQKFLGLLSLCTKNENIEFTYNKNGFKLGDELYTPEDFDAIKELIAEQNLLELPDDNIQKEVKDSLKKAEEFIRKSSGSKVASLEEQMICLSVATSLNLEEVYNLPIRKFYKMLSRADKKLHYQMYMTASMSGMVEFKDKTPLRHWMSDFSKDDSHSEAKMNLDSVKKKMGFEDLQKSK